MDRERVIGPAAVVQHVKCSDLNTDLDYVASASCMQLIQTPAGRDAVEQGLVDTIMPQWGRHLARSARHRNRQAAQDRQMVPLMAPNTANAYTANVE